MNAGVESRPKKNPESLTAHKTSSCNGLVTCGTGGIPASKGITFHSQH